MIFKRAVANLRAQDWMAITIEVVIVFIGVLAGIQVSNWNQDRIERRETERMLTDLRPALEHFIGFFDTVKPYYATTRAYSDTAFAGWQGDPGVSDKQFVIAAYQSSQVYGLEINAVNWATIFGSDQLRYVTDPNIRRGLAALMSVDFADVGPAAVRTPYRQHVRETVPQGIQDAIRDQCGDRPIPGRPLLASLPPTCEIDLPAGEWAAAASALRAHAELASELRWHRAAVATFLFNLDKIDQRTRDLNRRISELEG